MHAREGFHKRGQALLGAEHGHDADDDRSIAQRYGPRQRGRGKTTSVLTPL
jgi:hypothetical protein